MTEKAEGARLARRLAQPRRIRQHEAGFGEVGLMRLQSIAWIAVAMLACAGAAEARDKAFDLVPQPAAQQAMIYRDGRPVFKDQTATAVVLVYSLAVHYDNGVIISIFSRNNGVQPADLGEADIRAVTDAGQPVAMISVDLQICRVQKDA